MIRVSDTCWPQGNYQFLPWSGAALEICILRCSLQLISLGNHNFGDKNPLLRGSKGPRGWSGLFSGDLRRNGSTQSNLDYIFLKLRDRRIDTYPAWRNTGTVRGLNLVFKSCEFQFISTSSIFQGMVVFCGNLHTLTHLKSQQN